MCTYQCNVIHFAAGSQLSGGAVAGIVIPLLLVLLVVGAGVTAGLLLWIYRPWENCSLKTAATDGE